MSKKSEKTQDMSKAYGNTNRTRGLPNSIPGFARLDSSSEGTEAEFENRNEKSSSSDFSPPVKPKHVAPVVTSGPNIGNTVLSTSQTSSKSRMTAGYDFDSLYPGVEQSSASATSTRRISADQEKGGSTGYKSASTYGYGYQRYEDGGHGASKKSVSSSSSSFPGSLCIPKCCPRWRRTESSYRSTRVSLKSRGCCSRCWRKTCNTVSCIFDYILKIFDLVLKILGPFLVLLAFALYWSVGYVYFHWILQRMYIETWQKFLLGFIGLSFEWNIQYNHAAAMLTGPGNPPKFDPADTELCEMIGKAQIDAPIDAESMRPKCCSKCERVKPARTHHCSVCNVCVLKMDHHCPWINNCVGYENYHNFCLFLLNLWMGCIFFLVTSYDQFYEAMFFGRTSRHRSFEVRQYISFAYVLCGSILMAVSLLGGFHFYLSCTNQSTIEFQLNWMDASDAKKSGQKWVNPYGLGCQRNLAQVFGEEWIPAFFPWLKKKKDVNPYGGLSFPKLTNFQI